MGIYISGLGSYLPHEVVDNYWFESRLDTTDQWIFDKVGIKTRRRASNQETTSDLAVFAA
jgi:3-oxoacyl-[acyl-carrier-protein] synthase III